MRFQIGDLGVKGEISSRRGWVEMAKESGEVKKAWASQKQGAP